jgi:hypothetical protein
MGPGNSSFSHHVDSVQRVSRHEAGDRLHGIADPVACRIVQVHIGCVVTNFVTLDFLVFGSSVSRVSIIRACTDHAQELRDCHFQFWSEQKLDQLLCGSI